MTTFQKQTLRNLPEIGNFIKRFIDDINSIRKFVVSSSLCTNYINQPIKIHLNDKLPELKLINELKDVKNGRMIFQGNMVCYQEVSHKIKLYLNYNKTSSEINIDFNEFKTDILTNQYCIVKPLQRNTNFLIKIL
jgi:hypothetical protein